MNEQKLGIVYILSNQAMPGLIKIGSTTENELKNRLSNLYSTGVPFPFEFFKMSMTKLINKNNNS